MRHYVGSITGLVRPVALSLSLFGLLNHLPICLDALVIIASRQPLSAHTAIQLRKNARSAEFPPFTCGVRVVAFEQLFNALSEVDPLAVRIPGEPPFVDACEQSAAKPMRDVGSLLRINLVLVPGGILFNEAHSSGVAFIATQIATVQRSASTMHEFLSPLRHVPRHRERARQTVDHTRGNHSEFAGATVSVEQIVKCAADTLVALKREALRCVAGRLCVGGFDFSELRLMLLFGRHDRPCARAASTAAGVPILACWSRRIICTAWQEEVHQRVEFARFEEVVQRQTIFLLRNFDDHGW